MCTQFIYNKNYVLSWKYEICTLCKSLWIKASAKCPECKCKCNSNLFVIVISTHGACAVCSSLTGQRGSVMKRNSWFWPSTFNVPQSTLILKHLNTFSRPGPLNRLCLTAGSRPLPHWSSERRGEMVRACNRSSLLQFPLRRRTLVWCCAGRRWRWRRPLGPGWCRGSPGRRPAGAAGRADPSAGSPAPRSRAAGPGPGANRPASPRSI